MEIYDCHPYILVTFYFRYTFYCDDWISSYKVKPSAHQLYKAASAEEGSFSSLFKGNARSKIFDDHLWLSLVKRPTRSNFSRVQRLSLCASTLFLTMVVNAMWSVLESSLEVKVQ